MLGLNCWHSFCSENKVLRHLDLDPNIGTRRPVSPQEENGVVTRKFLGGGEVWFLESCAMTPKISP